ncbi:MAG: glycosyltransferase [Streptosporangiales bacterium]|nr:glycosyltransferase [Streptosporangiales bacterium]
MEAPIYVGELEITEPVAALNLPDRADGRAWTGVHSLVRMRGIPVGYAFLETGALDPAGIARQVWSQLGPEISARCERAGAAAPGSLPETGLRAVPDPDDGGPELPAISVVVCTRDRPGSVVTALGGLTGLDYPSFEIVVVDNAPSSDATRDAVRSEFSGDPRVRYVREPRPGLSRARNRGVAEASAEIVAFTDDDVRVDKGWLAGIARGFRAAPGVSCVTGLIATARLENAEQLYFHLREGWGASCERRVYDLAGNRDESPLYPYSPGIFGAGASFAMTRTALRDVGGFDEALGAGTPSGGGEDLDMFMRVILGGHRLVYEPAAVVWHFHRTELAELTRQMRAYGSGCTAALTAIVMKNPRSRVEIPPRVARGVARVFTLNDRVKDNPTLPPGLMRREMAGLLAGPGLYLKGRREARR